MVDRQNSRCSEFALERRHAAPSLPRLAPSARVVLAALVSLLSACSSSNLHYSALEPYPPVDELLAEHGHPDEEIAWSHDHWTGSVCDADTARVLVYHDLRGPLGRRIHAVIGGGETIVCVSRSGPVSLIQDVVQ